MWDISNGSGIIQLEIGSNVILAYSSKRKSQCDILLNQIGDLRSRLAERHIPLPAVAVRDSSELSPDEFILYLGVICIKGNYKTDHILQILMELAQDYYLKDDSYEGLMELFQTGVKYLEARNYQKAIYEFARAYYCASFSADALGIMVNSMINICGIQFLNQQYDAAMQSGQRACILAISDDFYDPYLKYYAAAWTGAVFIQQQNWSEAVKHFILAYNVICQTDESSLAVAALSTAAQLCMEMQNFAQSSEIIDKILDILQNNKNLGAEPDFVINLARFQSHVNKALISQLTSEYERLRKEYHGLSQSFLVQLKNFALNMIYKYGNLAASCAMGSLLAGTNSFECQLSLGGSNIKGANTVVITGR